MKFFKNLFGKKQDELIGIWQTTNEGGFQIMMGSELIFNADGTGSEYSWGHGEDEEPYEYRNAVLWLRKSENTIAIKKTGEPHYTDITYKIETYIGAYNVRYDEMFEPGHTMEKWNIKGFWGIPGALYRKQ